MNWDRGAGVLPTTHRHMTAVEYYRLPEGPPYFQLISGELFMSPSPNFFHQQIVGRIHGLIWGFLRQNPLGSVIMAPADVELGPDDVYQPDLYFIRKERMAMVDEHGAKGAPDLIVEVLSPGTARLDLGPKKETYANQGVEELWLIQPSEKTVQIYRLNESSGQPFASLGIGEAITTPILPGLVIPVGELFG